VKKLLDVINLLKDSDVRGIVDSRIREFKSNKNFFSELCFCILTANFSAGRSIMIQREVGDGFLTLSEPELAARLKELGHRFPNTRAKYIVQARGKKLVFDRDWLVKNIKGLGYKEASHFLRNIGYDDFGIVDFHIVDLLVKYGLIEKPKTITKQTYFEIEKVLRGISRKANLSLAKLDLYLWFLETGKILK